MMVSDSGGGPSDPCDGIALFIFISGVRLYRAIFLSLPLSITSSQVSRRVFNHRPLVLA